MDFKRSRSTKVFLSVVIVVCFLFVAQGIPATDTTIPVQVKGLRDAFLKEVAGLGWCYRLDPTLSGLGDVYFAKWRYCTDPGDPSDRRNDWIYVYLEYRPSGNFISEERWREITETASNFIGQPVIRVREVDGYPTLIVTEEPGLLKGVIWQGRLLSTIECIGETVADYSTYDEAFRDIYGTLMEHAVLYESEQEEEEAIDLDEKEDKISDIPQEKEGEVTLHDITTSSHHMVTLKKGRAETLGEIWITNNSSVTLEEVVVTFSPSENLRIAFVNAAQRTAYVGRIEPWESKEVFDLVPPLIRGINRGKDSIKYTINASNLAKPWKGVMEFEVVSISTYDQTVKKPLEDLLPGVAGWKLDKDQLPEDIQLQIPQETYLGGYELEFSDWQAEISRIPSLLSTLWKGLGIIDALIEDGLTTTLKETVIQQGLKKTFPGVAKVYVSGKSLLHLASNNVSAISIGSKAGQAIANYFDEAIEPAYRLHELVDKGALLPLKIIMVQINGWNAQIQSFESGLRFYFLNGARYWEEYSNTLVYIEMDLCRVPDDIGGLNLKVQPFPIYIRSGESVSLVISIENVSSSKREGIYIHGEIEQKSWPEVAEMPSGFLYFDVEPLARGDIWISPQSVTVSGLEKGSAKLVIDLCEEGIEPLRWEIPILIE